MVKNLAAGLQKIENSTKDCPLVIFDILPQKYNSFTSRSSHFQKNSFTCKACDTF